MMNSAPSSTHSAHGEALLAFASSARLALWPAIALSSFSFAYLLNYDMRSTALIALNLCTIASLGFLVNDALDAKIDEANKVQRWSIKMPFDWLLICLAGTLESFLLFASQTFLNQLVFVSLLFSLLMTVLYSLICKKILLLGNIVAAGLSVTPGLVMFIDVYANRLEGVQVGTAAAFIALGFLLLLSREIRFDEFDEVGDRIGDRLTLPMVFGHTAITGLHVVLSTVAILLLFAIIAVEGRYSFGLNIFISLCTASITASLLIAAFRSASKVVYYRVTRAVMLLVPISIFVSF